MGTDQLGRLRLWLQVLAVPAIVSTVTWWLR
jgi:hypothetical protein